MRSFCRSTELSPKEGETQAPELGAFVVVGRAAVAAFGVFPIEKVVPHFLQARGHFAGMRRVHSIIVG